MAFDYTSEFRSRHVCDPDDYDGAFAQMGAYLGKATMSVAASANSACISRTGCDVE